MDLLEKAKKAMEQGYLYVENVKMLVNRVEIEIRLDDPEYNNICFYYYDQAIWDDQDFDLDLKRSKYTDEKYCTTNK